MFKLNESRRITVADFIKYAPLGLEVMDVNNKIYYDPTEDYPWRYSNSALQRCWSDFTITPEDRYKYESLIGRELLQSNGTPFLRIIALPRPTIRRKNHV